MSGILVISLDFELMWGVRDHSTVASYGDAVLGGRRAIPEVLRLFEGGGIRATWATVGLLFARHRSEMLDFAPRLRPEYARPEYSPYAAIENEIGADERSDPFHFGRSLIERISETEGQEIATHTFSHYYTLEDGQAQEAFEADLDAAIAIAKEAGVTLGSIVFPRDQMGDEHVSACATRGILAYRGNPDTFTYRTRSKGEISTAVRAARLLDSVVPIEGQHGYAMTSAEMGVSNVPSSRFLRPYRPRAPQYSKLHLRRIKREMTSAARKDHLYHLWWHPHNFGRNVAHNLHQLATVIDHFRHLRDACGMESVSMAKVQQRGLTASMEGPRISE